MLAHSFLIESSSAVGNQDRHKSLDGFNLGPLVSMAHLYVFFLNERLSSSACGYSKDLFFQYHFDWPSLM